MSQTLPIDALILLTILFSVPLLCFVVAASWLSYRIARRFKLLPPDKKIWVERRGVIVPVGAVLAVYLLCFAYGVFIEAGWVQTTVTEIKVKEPVLGYERFRIVHLSDLHLERIGRREYRMMEQVVAAKPQLILLTGDYINVREGAAALSEVLGALRAEHGVFGIEGNWDRKFLTADLFQRSKHTFLVDDTRVLERNGRRLRLAGQAMTPGRTIRELLPPADDGIPTIYLHHSPDAVDELRARAPGQRIDLFLCGHTHGGQVRLPGWGAVLTRTRHHKKYERGLFDVDGIPMYVNRGVGCSGGALPPVRFLCRPEVAVIDLVHDGPVQRR